MASSASKSHPKTLEKTPPRFADMFSGFHFFTLRGATLSPREQVLKRAFDIAASGTALLLLSLPLLVCALAVKMTSPGPVFFRQPRWGLDGRIFHIYKFRSMYHDQCDDGKSNVVQAQRHDSRITPIGGVLRRTSLDELPQLLNVLKGEMSLIGPRPHAVAHNEFYTPLISNYIIRHRIKPGLSGLAQVHGYRGETPEMHLMEKRVGYDAAYIRHWSLGLDLKIIFKTFGLLASRKNAH